MNYNKTKGSVKKMINKYPVIDFVLILSIKSLIN
jgi:hypothetical protein